MERVGEVGRGGRGFEVLEGRLVEVGGLVEEDEVEGRGMDGTRADVRGA